MGKLVSGWGGLVFGLLFYLPPDLWVELPFLFLDFEFVADLSDPAGFNRLLRWPAYGRGIKSLELTGYILTGLEPCFHERRNKDIYTWRCGSSWS